MFSWLLLYILRTYQPTTGVYIYFTCGLNSSSSLSPTLIGEPKNVERTQNARLTATRKEWRTDRRSPDNESSTAGRETISIVSTSQIEQSKSVCDMSAKDNRHSLLLKKKAEHVAWTFLLSCARMAVLSCWWEGVEFVWPPPPTSSNVEIRDVSFWPYSVDQKSFHNHSARRKRHAVSYWKTNFWFCVCQSAKSIQKCEYL